jgi:RHS repeat-associated protein
VRTFVTKDPSLVFDRGYTGHEHLDEFGLINCNARLYDPVLGRFLSPDPYVQDPLFSQSYKLF